MRNLKLLSEIALCFQRNEDFEGNLNKISELIGKSLNLSKINIFISSPNEMLSNIFEWCNLEIMATMDSLQEIKGEIIQEFLDEIGSVGFIYAGGKIEFKDQIISRLYLNQMKSMVAYPLVLNHGIRGFIGFYDYSQQREWSEEEIQILSTVSLMISNAYEQNDSKDHQLDSEGNFQNFFETIDDMFIVSDAKGNILTCNNTVLKKLGYSYEDFTKMNLIELHPKETQERAIILLKEMLNKDRTFCPIPFIGKFGQLYSVESRVWTGKWDGKDCIFSISKDLSKENQNLQLFSSIFENNPLPMTITDRDDGTIIEVNPAFLKKMGYEKKDILGKTIEDTDFLVDSNRLKVARLKSNQGIKIKEQEITLRRKNGKFIHGLFSIENITIQGKESFLTVVVDVTERVELARSIEDQLQKLTNVIDGTNLGTWEWDILSDEVKVNEHFASMIGQSLKESDITTIDSLNKFINPVDLESSKRVMGKHLDGDTEYYDFEMRMKHKNGQWVWIHNIGKVILRNEQGKPIKLFGTFSDITARKEAEKNLKESEERFLLALDETKAGLWDMDMMSKEMFLSPMLKQILGYEDEEVENTIDALNSLCHPDDIQKLYDAGQDYLKGRINSYEMVHRLKHKDGKWRWILTRGGVLKDDHGQPIRWIGTNIDVTAEYEQSLELERFFSINLDLLSIMDSNGTFIKINKAWEEKFGCSSSEIEGQRYDKFIHPDDLARTEESSVNLRQEGVVKNFTNRYLCADGQYHYFEWKANQYGDVIYAAARDITERVHYENKILDLSHRDVLTNIYNRRFIYEKAEKILGESRKVNKDFSIAILDLDEFKLINDGYGHQIGDCVLKEFTKIVGDNLEEETLLGRYGGEEFIIIFENSSIHDSEGTMQNILHMIRKNLFKYDDIEINLTFSAGISSSSEIDKEMMGIDDLVKLADSRMYQAKKSGKNRIVIKDHE